MDNETTQLKTHVCARCKEELPIKMFHTRLCGKRLQPYCIPCKREYNREYNRKKRQNRGIEIKKENKFITCKRCGEEKLYTGFGTDRTGKRMSTCYSCYREQSNRNNMDRWIKE